MAKHVRCKGFANICAASRVILLAIINRDLISRHALRTRLSRQTNILSETGRQEAVCLSVIAWCSCCICMLVLRSYKDVKSATRSRLNIVPWWSQTHLSYWGSISILNYFDLKLNFFLFNAFVFALYLGRFASSSICLVKERIQKKNY